MHPVSINEQNSNCLWGRGQPPRRTPSTAAGRLRFTVLGLALMAAATGCGDGRAPDGRSARAPTLIVVGPHESDPHWPAVRGAAERYARAIPSVRIVCEAVRRPDGGIGGEIAAQLATGRTSAACVWVGPAGLQPLENTLRVLDQLHKARIAVITIGERIEHASVCGRVCVSNPDAAELLGSQLDALARPGRTYLVYDREGASAADTDVTLRFLSAAGRQPRLEPLMRVSNAGRGVEAQVAVERLVSLFPNSSLLVLLDPAVWLTAPFDWDNTLRARNARIRVATASSAPQLWRHLGSADAPGLAAALVGPLHGQMVYDGMQMAIELVTIGRRAGLDIAAPVELITPDTLPDFARRYAEAAGGIDVSPFLPADLRRAMESGAP